MLPAGQARIRPRKRLRRHPVGAARRMLRRVPVLRFPDAEHALADVRLVTDLWKREPPRPYARVNGGWELELAALPVDRLEYQLDLVRADGSHERALDPAAPTVEEPFGSKSVLETAAYRPPGWLGVESPPGTIRPLDLRSDRLGGSVEGLLWCAPGLTPDEPAPLLVVHDGPEYARFSALDRYLAAAVAHGALPRLRAALLAPVSRSEHYSASALYARALARDLVPALERLAPTPGRGYRAGLGASLGALALFHAHRRHPELFGALALQSGSFFRRRLDGQERWFDRFDRIDRFVRAIETTALWPDAVPVALTCGTGEENLANNRTLAAVLAAQGYPVHLHEVRDGHTWTCWRDGLEAALGRLGSLWA